jgi:sugar lactone lactonase YvrE
MANTNSDPKRWKLARAAIVAVLLLVACGNRANPAPKPQAPPPFEFLGAWGDKGDGPGKLDDPVAFATDALGHVFFADPGAGYVHKFESNGTPLLSFEDARVRHASGIAVDSGGAIYIADAERGNILIFFPDGTFLRAMRIAPQRHFSGAFGISTDEYGNLYVPDPGRSRVLKFDNHGRLVKSWPAPQKAESGEERPSSVAAAQDGSVFVAYFKTGRIERFSSDGSWMTSWTAASQQAGETNPITGFAVAGEFVYTLAASSGEIRVWTLEGQLSLEANLGEHLGPVAAPQIAVTPISEFLVFDPSASKVFRFRIHSGNKEPQ